MHKMFHTVATDHMLPNQHFGKSLKAVKPLLPCSASVHFSANTVKTNDTKYCSAVFWEWNL